MLGIDKLFSPKGPIDSFHLHNISKEHLYAALQFTQYFHSLCIFTLWFDPTTILWNWYYSLHRWGKQSSERLNHLVKVTQQLIHGEVKTKNEIFQLQSCVFPPLLWLFTLPCCFISWILYDLYRLFSSWLVLSFVVSSSCLSNTSEFQCMTHCTCSSVIVLHLTAEGGTRLHLPQAGPLRHKCTHSDQWRGLGRGRLSIT